MTNFMQHADTFRPVPGQESVLQELPVGNYTIGQDVAGMFFQRVPMFTDPGKLYGAVDTRAERILNTFQTRPRATGVLLAGEKGSGKSLLAYEISRKGYQLGMPTIIINAPWHGDGFNTLLAGLKQDVIVLMDEFEKVYDKNQQEAVLTLLDGTMTTKKLFVLTVNDKWGVDSHMRNRPGRLFYNLEFSGLEPEFVREYCEDRLHEQEHTDAHVGDHFLHG